MYSNRPTSRQLGGELPMRTDLPKLNVLAASNNVYPFIHCPVAFWSFDVIIAPYFPKRVISFS